jgi:hypothetical protein
MKNIISLLLLSLIAVGLVGGDWVFTRACQGDKQVATGTLWNGNCLEQQTPYGYQLWTRLSCGETQVTSSRCSDPLCSICAEPYAQNNLNTCDDGLYIQCFAQMPPLEKLMGGSYAYVARMQDRNCTAGVFTSEVSPLGCSKRLHGGSVSYQCEKEDKWDSRMHIMNYDTDDCTGNPATKTIDVLKCDANSGTFAACVEA